MDLWGCNLGQEHPFHRFNQRKEAQDIISEGK